ncbi:unnamed protein product [Didymodactylos carnosus]|uniref:Uncharacterized protein n=1 Tax=Didymodactylos carnosus TaxID=1234261 RepID=A0A813Q147_9BILA|nr:unnamed protein product [Didymodactylos carnosus]CAF1216388.1 unnamed protein product [Didymodactylos carnosus]CAF3540352.1 unnamed protein product [Didymodactylos carnosus]CAF4024821.1 unnamed protein product [Didymodactylos carnosus]
MTSCSAIYVCFALVCWDQHTILFTNLSHCTPTSIPITKISQILSVKHFDHVPSKGTKDNPKEVGYSCLYCTQMDFIDNKTLSITFCNIQHTKVELRNFCISQHDSLTKAKDQCYCSEKVNVQPIRAWSHSVEIPLGKSMKNSALVTHINKDSFGTSFIIGAMIIGLIITGGLISMLYYVVVIRAQTRERTTFE